MSEQAAKVLEQAMSLPEAERRWVADELMDQLGGLPTDDELADSSEDPEFVALIEQRIADHAANPDDAMPAAEALAAIRAELERRQACRSR